MTLAPEQEDRPEPGRSFPVAAAWAPAFAAVPRSLFLPDLIWAYDMATGTSRPLDRTADESTWRAAAAADIPIVTQWDDGEHRGTEPGTVPTSSASQPSLVAAMLDDLRVESGMRVLEQGTGTGWNAALLAHRIGDANVTTIEIDPQVSARARAALHAAGHRPHLVCGDGALGHPPGAPYDRITVTYGLREIPRPWIEQTRPGGMILAPFGTHYSNADALVRLTVARDGTATGPFLQPVEFMKMRSQRLRWPNAPADGGTVAEGTTTATLPGHGKFDPFPLAAGLRLRDVVHAVQPHEDGARTLWLYSLTVPAWAAATFRDGETAHLVRQYGGRRLWDDFERALAWWHEAGRPGTGRLGLTVTPDGWHAWLDDPAQPV
ncbi:protein-L-isoaspartate O-methyltransferase [Kitasatospora sp. SolWspMP-SS2h]|uniref:methyltransferase domain-containing protein n=1 Tax=Kitasatospora sp. SolWspMP-SS2h TaxID=1305729 RepID=UPI000DB9F68B|nr:methyltransferase domain-containing protein [Kitasatospora sp. SolWspMP-SS2h]RAJ35318.1 protein-L-isoaspartate O-methyltransferase [Kitasatospora sp. SolWspMP-SS2h]